MSTIITDDLLDQFLKAIAMVRFTTEEFEDAEWMSGVPYFQTPARLGWHIVESLDFYFSGKKNSKEFKFGHRFGGTPSWKLPDEKMPKKADCLTYLDEIKDRIETAFASLEDKDLSAPYQLYDWSGKTLLGHYVYAIRHTMEHHGALTVIATHFGHTAESWQ
jgi:uncharacterized damage-inducible protein DinB